MFVQPKTAKEWEQYMLTEEQVASFKKDGFVKGIKILTEEQVDILNEELSSIAIPKGRGKKIILPLRKQRIRRSK